jgi:hypothetical protein
MFERGELGAETYQIPQAAPQPVGHAQQPFDDGVVALQGLQHVKGQTEDYYKKVAALKSFMQDVHANYGLDVRVPDMSRPESIRLHQIYNDAISDILAQGNLLKNSHGTESQLLNMRAQFRSKNPDGTPFDPKSMAAEEMVQGQDYSLGLNPIVAQVNASLKLAHDKTSMDEANADRDRAIAELESQKNGQNDWAIDQSIAAIQSPRRVSKEYRETDAQRARRAKDNSIDVELRKIVNIVDGTNPQWKNSNEPIPGGDGFYRINTEYKGLKLGDDGIIDRMRENQETGEKEWVFKDGHTQPVDGDPKVELKKLVDANPRFSATGSEIDDYIFRKKAQTSSGALDPTPFLAPKEEREQHVYKQGEQEAVLQAKQEPIISAVKEKVKNATPGWISLFNDTRDIDIPMGSANSIELEATDKGKFTMANFEDAFPKSLFKDSKGKVDQAKYERTKNNLTNQPVEVVLRELLKRIPESKYPEVFKAFGLDPNTLKGTSSLVKQAKANYAKQKGKAGTTSSVEPAEEQSNPTGGDVKASVVEQILDIEKRSGKEREGLKKALLGMDAPTFEKLVSDYQKKGINFKQNNSGTIPANNTKKKSTSDPLGIR